MTFKQITDSFNKRFHDLSLWLNDYLYKFNHLELDSDSESSAFYYDSAQKKEYAIFACQCFRDLISLSDDIEMFYRFASKDSEKDLLWKLHCDVEDFIDLRSECVHEIRYMYDWAY